jgi:mRNA interferase RelE/StbE
MDEYRLTESFKRDYKTLENDIKETAKKAFGLFKENTNHPSLRIKRMRGHKSIWEGHITEKYVFTFHKEKGDNCTIYWFRRIGDHTIYKNP